MRVTSTRHAHDARTRVRIERGGRDRPRLFCGKENPHAMSEKKETSPQRLSRRERQIMEIVYARGQAGVAEVLAAMADPPSYSAVRAMMNLLEQKGQLTHKEEGRRFVYRPTVPREKARRSALTSLLQTFFGGSVSQAVASLLDLERKKLSEEELERLARLIEEAKQKEGR